MSEAAPSTELRDAFEEAFQMLGELRLTFEEIKKGETMNASRSTTDDDTSGTRFFKSYVPRKMKITDAQQLAHHAVIKINRFLTERSDV